MEFRTEIEFFGEDREVVVEWDAVDGECVVRSVTVALIVENQWTPQGKWKQWTERYELDVKSILSDEQIFILARRIKADCLHRAAEDFDDSRLMDREERTGGRWLMPA